MNNLLIFFALPIATIILAIVLQKVLRSPILVAATAFAIYLIVTFAVFDASFLIFTILYTILAFLAAYFTCIILKSGIFNCSTNNNTVNSCGCINQSFSDTSNIDNLNFSGNYNINNQNIRGTLYRCRK